MSLPEVPLLKITVLLKLIIRIIYYKLINPPGLLHCPLSPCFTPVMTPMSPRVSERYCTFQVTNLRNMASFYLNNYVSRSQQCTLGGHGNQNLLFVKGQDSVLGTTKGSSSGLCSLSILKRISLTVTHSHSFRFSGHLSRPG